MFLRFASDTSVISRRPPPSARSTSCQCDSFCTVCNCECVKKRGFPLPVLHNISAAILKTFVTYGTFCSVAEMS